MEYLHLKGESNGFWWYSNCTNIKVVVNCLLWSFKATYHYQEIRNMTCGMSHATCRHYFCDLMSRGLRLRTLDPDGLWAAAGLSPGPLIGPGTEARGRDSFVPRTFFSIEKTFPLELSFQFRIKNFFRKLEFF